MNEMRLQKYLSICGIASRRKSEAIIKEGLVKVNGEVVFDRSYKVSEYDQIEYSGQLITPHQKIYIILNKPEKFLCTHDDQWGRETIYDLVPYKDKRLFSLGRLDYESCGLIILTNDGEFANNIIHPSKSVLKEYMVTCQNEIPDILISSFLKGVKVDDITYKAGKIIRNQKKQVRVFLNEGKKREIRIVFKEFKCKILKLERIAIGYLKLNELNLSPGEYLEVDYDFITNKIFNKS